MWKGVRQRFSRFDGELRPTADQTADAMGKQQGVRQSLDRWYYGQSREHPPGLIVGSWGKGTATRRSQDIDVLFEMPPGEFKRFDSYATNGQSALLQEVRSALAITYPNTIIRGDGQVAVVAFNTITVEVLPAFRVDGGQYIYPDSHDGGRWERIAPNAELDHVTTTSRATNGNVCALSRMLKVWKRHHRLPLKSFLIEQIVADTIPKLSYAGADYYWYDWFIRDLFDRLVAISVGGWVRMPGTGKIFQLGDGWQAAAKQARDHAHMACEWEKGDYTVSAGEVWQQIFGPKIPTHVL